MNDLIKYLDKILNIKIDNPLVIEDMKLELGKVNDIVAYRIYIRDHLDIEYKTGFQKFIILTNQYLDIEEDQVLQITQVYSKADQYAKKVSDKVKECRTFVEDNLCAFAKVKFEGGDLLFEDHEIRCLEAVGTDLIVCEYSRMNLLFGHIKNDYVKNTKQNLHENKLTDQQKRVMDMITHKGS